MDLSPKSDVHEGVEGMSFVQTVTVRELDEVVLELLLLD